MRHGSLKLMVRGPLARISLAKRAWWRGCGRAARAAALGAPIAFAAAVVLFSGGNARDALAQAGAGDAAAGKTKAALCAACHGPVGVSVNPMWPSLAGQQPAYLAKQIRLFRDGARVEPTMQPFVQTLSDQDIDDLAAYYASLSPCP